jgi:energy-coupling factor transport system substrate-specific component
MSATDPAGTGRTVTRPRRATTVLRLSTRSTVVLVLASVGALAVFCWPFLVGASPAPAGGTGTEPVIFIAILPVLVLIVLAEISTGGLDAKAVAMLGVLSAVNAALRPLGAGTAGIETVFFLLILAGRVFGPAFGFVLGSTSLFASALLTAGVGPWLPYQMLAASWVGLGAGLLPGRLRGRAEIAQLCGYGVLAAYGYGLLMNLSTWPFAIGSDTQLSYVAGGALWANLHRFLVFTLITSTAGWDTGRAITNVVAIVVVGPAVLVALRRAARRASFSPAVSFHPGPAQSTVDAGSPVEPLDPATLRGEGGPQVAAAGHEHPVELQPGGERA